MKRYHDHDNPYEGKHLTEVLTYNFRGLVHYHHGREHDSMQAHMLLEKELLHVDMQTTGSKLSITLSEA